MGYAKLLTAMLLTSLFAVAILNYAVNFGDDNNVVINLDEDSTVTTAQSNIQTDVVNYRGEQESSLETLYQTKLDANDETTRTGGQFKGQVNNSFDAVKQVLIMGNKRIFGSEQGNNGLGIFITSLIAFLGMLLGLYMYKMWIGKNPD